MKEPAHVARARAALALCTPAERAALFRESGECLCLATVGLVRDHPRLATGAAIGAVVAVLLGPVEKATEKKAAELTLADLERLCAAERES